jgi:hypothetical protein
MHCVHVLSIDRFTLVRPLPGGRNALELPFGGDRRVPLEVLLLVGKWRYLQVTLVCHEWRSLYMRLFRDVRTDFLAVLSTPSLLAWMRDCGYTWTQHTAHRRRRSLKGHAVVPHANGCSWCPSACDAAAAGGHLELLQWAQANNCTIGARKYSSQSCDLAARGGHLETLQWLRANGCVWCLYTCSAAASGGHLDVLQSVGAHGVHTRAMQLQHTVTSMCCSGRSTTAAQARMSSSSQEVQYAVGGLCGCASRERCQLW